MDELEKELDVEPLQWSVFAGVVALFVKGDDDEFDVSTIRIRLAQNNLIGGGGIVAQLETTGITHVVVDQGTSTTRLDNILAQLDGHPIVVNMSWVRDSINTFNVNRQKLDQTKRSDTGQVESRRPSIHEFLEDPKNFPNFTLPDDSEDKQLKSGKICDVCGRIRRTKAF